MKYTSLRPKHNGKRVEAFDGVFYIRGIIVYNPSMVWKYSVMPSNGKEYILWKTDIINVLKD